VTRTFRQEGRRHANHKERKAAEKERKLRAADDQREREALRDGGEKNAEHEKVYSECLKQGKREQTLLHLLAVLGDSN